MLLSLAFIPILIIGGSPQDTPAAPANDIQAAYNSLKTAIDQRDVELIKKTAVEAARIADKTIKSPQPADAAEVASWKNEVEFAKEVQTHAGYGLYVATLRASERTKRLELFETLDKEIPNSKYLSDLYGVYLGALAQGGQNAKAYEYAGKAVSRDPNNEDLLAVLADGAMTRKQWDRAATFGSRLASVMSGHPRPEGTPTGDWEKRRSQMVGRGNWIAGISYISMNRFAQADKCLRAALPLVQGDPNLIPAAVFNLGVANYNLARATQDKVMMKQALAFFEDAYKQGGQYGALAGQNIVAVKQELGRMR